MSICAYVHLLCPYNCEVIAQLSANRLKCELIKWRQFANKTIQEFQSVTEWRSVLDMFIKIQWWIADNYFAMLVSTLFP